MIVELIVTILVVVMLIKLIADARNSKISVGKLLFWAFVWIALEVIVLIPGLVMFIANLIGIERPKDLPIYASIIILFFLILRIGIKIERIEQEITSLVKNVALKN